MRSDTKWARLPTRQIVYGRILRSFRADRGELGVSVAALKIYVAVTLMAENKSSAASGIHQGTISMTYDELIEITDLSRSMISHGISLLTELGILSISKEGRGRKNRYALADYGSDDKWAKLPKAKLSLKGVRQTLHQFSPRRRSDLDALKLYLLFAAFRNIKTDETMIGYDKITSYTGINPARIRRGISQLIEHELIVVSRDPIDEESVVKPNRYRLLGLKRGEPQSSYSDLGVAPQAETTDIGLTALDKLL